MKACSSVWEDELERHMHTCSFLDIQERSQVSAWLPAMSICNAHGPVDVGMNSTFCTMYAKCLESRCHHQSPCLPDETTICPVYISQHDRISLEKAHTATLATQQAIPVMKQA